MEILEVIKEILAKLIYLIKKQAHLIIRAVKVGGEAHRSLIFFSYLRAISTLFSLL